MITRARAPFGSARSDRPSQAAPPFAVDLPTRAFVEIARAFMHGYENAGVLTEARLRELAPLFDILLEHKRPGDIRTLWVHGISAYEEGSPLRDLIANPSARK